MVDDWLKLGALWPMNPYRLAVLKALHSPASVDQVHRDSGVPINTCYRMVRELLRAGFIRLYDKHLGASGKVARIYVATVAGLTVEFDERGIQLIVRMPSGEVRHSRWQPITFPFTPIPEGQG